MDKKHVIKAEKSEKTCCSNSEMFVKFGFWTMIGLFIVNILVSTFLKQPIVGYITEALFYISVIFVFVNAVRYLMPEGKGFVVIALIVSSALLLFVLLMAMVALLTATSGGAFG